MRALLVARRLPRWAIALMLLLGWMSWSAQRTSAAGTYLVSTTADSGAGSLRDAITSAVGDPGSTIEFDIPGGGTITLLDELPMITASVVINGQSDVTIDGYDGSVGRRIFFVQAGTVTISNLSLVNGEAQGGSGGTGTGGGGGGLGAGGALYVNTGANVTIENVNFLSNTATGGNGGAGGVANGGGGGGSFGGANGGNGSNGGGGGAGFLGDGGDGSNGGGAGGGILGNGGNGSNGGGGGGGLTDGSNGANAGGNGNSGAAGGAFGGVTFGGTPANNGGDGASPVTGGGGGGGLGGINLDNAAAGGDGGSGGNGGIGGGGGGGGSDGSGDFSPTKGGDGGDGGQFGGGGGAGVGRDLTVAGGNGGEYGGGGGASTGDDSQGGNGGFGAGGGGSGNAGGGTGGTAGFGGGNGGDRNGGGNGGSAFGGAVFVRQGGSLIIAGNSSALLSGGSVTAGTGAASGDATGTGIYLHTGTTLGFNTSGQFTIYDSIAGTGGVELNGSGEVVMTNTSANTYTGDTTINDGRLRADGSIAGNVIVNTDGTLGGIGTIGGQVTNDGVVGPGNSIGTLSVDSYTQTAGGSLQIEIDASGTNDVLAVTGAATINGHLQVSAATGSYTVGTRYRFLTAGSISGTFSALDLPTINGIGFDVIYDTTWIDLLLLEAASNYTQFAVTDNQFAVATALDTIEAGGAGSFQPVLDALNTLTTPQAYQQAYDSMVGDIYATAPQTQIQTSTTWLQLTSNQLAVQMQQAMSNPQSPTNGLAAVPADEDVYLVSFEQPLENTNAVRPTIRRARAPQHRGWVQGFGQGGSVFGSGNASGVNYGLGGTVFGLDRRVSDSTVVGLLGGYAGSGLTSRNVSSNAQLNNYQVGVYGIHGGERAYFTDIDTYSGGSLTANRNIAFGGITSTATGNTNTNQWAHYNELGTTYASRGMRYQPFVGLQYIYFRQQGFTETGAGNLNLTVGSVTASSCRPSIGMRCFQDFSNGWFRMTPILHGRYQREIADGTQLVTSQFTGAPTVSFDTGGAYLGRDFGLFGFGLNMGFGSQTSIFAGCDTQVSHYYAAVSGTGGLQYRW